MNNQFLIRVLIVLLSGTLLIFVFKNNRQSHDQRVIDTVADTSTQVSNISEGQISKDTDTVLNVPQSSTLDLSNRNLNKVPSDIFEKRNIEKLDLSHNQLTGALQAEVRNLSSLRVLDVSDNQFTGVPAEVGQLKELEILDLSNNQLTGLPYELGNLRNLKVLDLRGNNYASADLEIIKKALPSTVNILKD